VRRLVSATVFPVLLAVMVGGSAWALASGVPAARVLAIASLASIVTVVLLERLHPHRREWNRSRGYVLTDALYLPTSVGLNGAVEPLARLCGVAIGAWLSAAIGASLWPSSWPLLAQVVLACVVAEAFDYWAHRVMHESALLWRVHATHHSAPRLYWLNATRSHPAEVLFRAVVSFVPLAVVGAGEQVLALYGVVTIVVGLFQHANVTTTLGPLSYVFSIGEVHRWHHSPLVAEANHNYGNNFLFWDVVFGTRYLPPDRPAPAIIGIEGLDAFPGGFVAQLASPLRWRSILAASRSAPTSS
jgi:sterol desaturase/sphingolipid hydroxylase (fatty acid hydroxylase superfamily)